MVDADKSGGLDKGELREVLRAVDVDVEGPEGAAFIDKFFDRVDLNHNGIVSFDELKKMVQSKVNWRITLRLLKTTANFLHTQGVLQGAGGAALGGALARGGGVHARVRAREGRLGRLRG